MDSESEASKARKIAQIKAEAAGRARAAMEERARKNSSASKRKLSSQPIRAINEDDDGYDPYSDLHDRRVEEPLFQRNPWE